MNDRYLFKAKRVDNGKWVQGYYYQIWENGYILWGMTNDVPNMMEVDVIFPNKSPHTKIKARQQNEPTPKS